MNTREQINYRVVLDDLKARKAQLESAIAAIGLIVDHASPTRRTCPDPLEPKDRATPEAGPFVGMSIDEAAKTYLATAGTQRSVKEIIDALETGGLRRIKYGRMYGILRRREANVGDIMHVKGAWELAEGDSHPKPAQSGQSASGIPKLPAA